MLPPGCVAAAVCAPLLLLSLSLLALATKGLQDSVEFGQPQLFIDLMWWHYAWGGGGHQGNQILEYAAKTMALRHGLTSCGCMTTRRTNAFGDSTTSLQKKSRQKSKRSNKNNSNSSRHRCTNTKTTTCCPKHPRHHSMPKHWEDSQLLALQLLREKAECQFCTKSHQVIIY